MQLNSLDNNLYDNILNIKYNVGLPVEKKEVNLDNPIFVVYLNIDGLSRQRAEEMIHTTHHALNYTNTTHWILPVHNQPTKIDCVYDGRARNRNIELSDFINEINKKIEILSNSHSFEDFKVNIRDWRINGLLDNNGAEQK